MTEEQIRETLEELYAERQELQEKLMICMGNIDTFEERLSEITHEENCRFCGTKKMIGYLCMECGRI